MKLKEILKYDNIIPDIKAANKKAVLEALVKSVAEVHQDIDPEKLLKILLEREQLGTTGVGDSVAIPHGKISGITQPIVAFGRCIDGVDFDALDGKLAYIFFLLIAPEQASSQHLQVLVRIAKILKNSAFRDKLIKSKSRDELYKIIIETDEGES